MCSRDYLVLAMPPLLFWLYFVGARARPGAELMQAATLADLPVDYRVEKTADGRFRWCLPVSKGAQLAFCGEPQKSEGDAIEDARRFANKEAPKK